MNDDKNIVEDWLKSLHLGQYSQSFIDNGYDDLEICKQIGEPDLDAIGVSDATHRYEILRAVRVLLEHGGTAVYFTLEEKSKEQMENVKEALAKEKEVIRSSHSPVKKYTDEYEEGKAEFVRFPKMQLKMIIRDKLVRDGIRLSAQPYTNPDGSKGHLDSLAGLYAEELRTHYRDVLDRLEELRKRRVAIDFPPLPLENESLKTSNTFKPGKYSPSSCLSDHEEENVYSLYQCPYVATSGSRSQRCLSPRSRYFYEPCPFPTGGGSKEDSSEHTKKRGGLGKLFRSLGSKKDKPTSKPGKPHLLQLSQKPPSKVPKLPAGDALLGDEERLQLMLLVRDGFLTMEQAVQKIRHREAERLKERGLQRSGRNEVITEFGKRIFWSPPGGKRRQPRTTAVFYPEMTTTCIGNHIYYEPPDDLDWEVEEIVGSKPPTEVRSELRPYTPEEFTSAILARSCPVGEGEGVATPSTTNQSSVPPQPPPPPPAAVCSREETRQTEYVSSPVMGRRCKGKLTCRLKNTTNRASYNAREEGHSQSSDYEEQDENENSSQEVQHRSSSSSSWTGRVKDLHRDVKRRISRLRSTRGSTSDNEMSKDSSESHDAIIRPGSSVESIPSGSGSRSSLQAPTPTSSNRSSTSAGEDDGTPFIGPLIGRARALVDYTPSPYDKDALAFKKGDIIDIVAKNKTGIWIGMVHGRVGHFKFINVEEIPGESRIRRRHRRSTEKSEISTKPDSLEDLLKQLGLEDYMNVFVLNGYEDLDTLKEVEKEDLDNLGITDPEHCQKLLRAIELLQDFDVGDMQIQEVEYQEENQKSSPRDSGCYASNENLAHKEAITSQNWLTAAENEENEVSQSESGIQSSEGPESIAAINNLDTNSVSGEVSQPVFLSSEKVTDLEENSSEGIFSATNYNIPPHSSFDVSPLIGCQHDIQVENIISPHLHSQDSQTSIDIEKICDKRSSSRSSVTVNSGRNSETVFSDYSVMNGRSERVLSEPNCKAPHLMSIHSPLSNCLLLSHVNIHENCNYGDFYCNRNKDTVIYSRQSQPTLSMDNFPKTSKSASLPRNKSQNGDNSNNSSVQKHSFFDSKKLKKASQRKASLQPVTRNPCPPSLPLLLSVTDKLEDENIDLCDEPYTDKMGFCGIPPALVQRYAEELHQDVYDIAHALDQTRINALQMRGHRAVPNDFLGDSCLGPVLEANYSSVTDWLISLGLPMYDSLLKMAGYNHLSQVATIRTTDLKDCGVSNAQHIRLLTSAISVLHLHSDSGECRYGSAE